MVHSEGKSNNITINSLNNDNNKSYMKVLFYSLFSLIAVIYSCHALKGISFLSNKYSSINGFSALIIFVLMLFFYKSAYRIKLSLLSISVGVFAGIINVLGRNFLLYNSLIFFYKERIFAILFSIAAVIGYCLLYATLFEWGWHYLCKTKKAVAAGSKSEKTVNFVLFDKHPFLYPFLFITFFWLPYFAAFYPGVVYWDAMEAFRQYYGLNVWTFQHPIIGVLLMGYTMDMGKYLGNVNYGCTVYVLLQYILFSLTLAYSFVFYKKWEIPYAFRWGILLFFSLFPVIPMYVVNEIKDTFYYVAVLWLLYLFIIALEKSDKKTFFWIMVAAMMTCSLRKEGVLICISCIIALAVLRNGVYKKWKNIIASITAGICVWAFITNVAGLYYNVEPASMREVLSLPVQQTARYIRDHGKDITASEWKVLKDIFGKNAEKLGKFYNPNRSDEVKFKMIYTLSNKQRKDYFKVWLAHLQKHLGCYLSAAFNQMYGYFYIGKPEFYGLGCSTHNFKEGHPMYTKSILVTDWAGTEKMRNGMLKYFGLWNNAILSGLLFHPATYTWLMFFALTSLIRFKTFRYLFLFCIPVATLAVCCLSPLNASIRYSFPIMLTSVLLLAFSIKVLQEQKD